MYAVSDAFLAALRQSHAVEVHVDIYYEGFPIYPKLPVSAGSVKVDGGSRVRRTVSLEVAQPGLAPRPGQDTVLSPIGMELYVNYGVRFVDGTIEWCPLGVFGIDTSGYAGEGVVSVVGSDRSKAVAEARFTSPMSSNPANTIPEEIERLILGARPDVTVIDETGVGTLCPRLVWDRERAEAIDGLAASIGAEWFFDPVGNAIIRPVPAITDPVVWEVGVGESGVMVQSNRATTRERTYNCVVAIGERTDGSAPVRAVVEDTDPTSPTYAAGAYGRVPYFYSSPLLTTTGQCTAAATSILARTKSLNRQLKLVAVPNPALTDGDVIEARFLDGTRERHIVDSLEVPFRVDDTMPIDTRSSSPEME